MSIISAELFVDDTSLLMRDPSGYFIDFPELLYGLFKQFEKNVFNNNIDCISLGAAGKKEQIDDHGDGFFAFTVIFWKRLKTGIFEEDDGIMANTQIVTLKCLDMISEPYDEDLLWTDVIYFDPAELALGESLFPSTNDFLTDVLDGVVYTNLEATIKSVESKVVNFEVGNFSFISAVTFLIKIHFDNKYDSIKTREEINPYVTIELSETPVFN